MTDSEKKTPHPLAAYIASEIHGDDEELSVYGTSISSDGLTVYIEGEHISQGEFSAELKVVRFDLIEEEEE